MEMRYFTKKTTHTTNNQTNKQKALKDCELIIHAIPAQFTPEFLEKHKKLIPANVPFVCTAKGIHVKSHKLMSDAVSDALGGRKEWLTYLSGPSFAKGFFSFFFLCFFEY